METVFAGSIEVAVLRNGREVDRVTRPLRRTSIGPVVRYKRQLWRVQNNSINVSGIPLTENEDGPTAPDSTDVDAAATRNPPKDNSTRDVASVDDEQTLVVEASCDDRLLVDAGPGTGKTHTACLKVAALITRDDIPPSRIWMISFTRTAVHEIRARLAALLPAPSDASSVRIATLDSLAWTIHSGFSKDAVLTGSYDDNIKVTLAKIRENSEMQEEFEKIRHVVIDEAQDIVGVRAELVLAIIDAVSSDCGVTVFADQAQAIYGFTEDERVLQSGVRLLEELEDREFKSISLTEIHRTDSPGLLRIFRDVRRKVLETDVPALARGAQIRSEIEQLADASLGHPTKLDFAALHANALVLMRQRSEVLITSSFNQNTSHRLRMSGLPVRVMPWPAVLFWDYCERRISMDRFEALWNDRIPATSDISSASAWQLLFETAGESATVADLHRLRSILGRSNPPAAFTSPDYGDTGPIVGTIHASKGREAEEVFLYLPPLPEEGDEYTDADEEVRVMFVGATRARSKLSVGASSGRRFGNIEGRFWKKLRGNALQVEIGRIYDLDAGGLVGRSTFRTAQAARAAQQVLLKQPIRTDLHAKQQREIGWDFALETADDVRIGALSKKVTADMRQIAGECESWPPPNYLPHIRSIGLRSIVVRPDDSMLDQLHEPWRTSGFVFAPMLVGICMTKLQG
ncbi:hypothetical protein ABIF69_005853 [Bradyrhizobium japonicum]